MKNNLSHSLYIGLFSALITIALHSTSEAKIGPAGCGLGNVVFGHQGSQILAATTNGSSGNQTSGITSGTSNCIDKNNYAKVIQFIESNQIALSNEAARGQGETIEALSQLYGCQGSSDLGKALKSNYQQIFINNGRDSVQISDSITGVIQQSQQLSQACPLHA